MNETELDSFFAQLSQDEFAFSDQLAPESLWRGLVDLTNRETNWKQAGIGRADSRQERTDIRGDRIFWLETDDARPEVHSVWQWLETWRRELNRRTFSGLQSVESHLAHYPPGAGYDWHLDRAPNTGHRQWTYLLYLNENWVPGDGGELEIEWPGESAKTRLIEPLAGRWVVFRSETFRHRVRAAHKDRKSLTGWFRDDDLGVPR